MTQAATPGPLRPGRPESAPLRSSGLDSGGPPTSAARAAIRRVLLAPDLAALSLCLVYLLIVLPFAPLMVSGGNIVNVVSNVWPLLVVAAGQTVVLVVGGIDLSQPATIALSSAVAAVFVTGGVNPDLFSDSVLWGWLLAAGGGPFGGSPLALAVAVGVAITVGAAVGVVNGLSITRLNMPPFIVTLVTATLFSAVAIWLTKSENVINLPPGWLAMSGGVGPFTWGAALALLLCLGTHVVLSRALVGRWVYAVGSNARAAQVAGVPVRGVVVLAYGFSGVCAGLGGLLYTSRLQVARPTTGADLLLDIIGATVIGGTSLFGGSGKVPWTMFGVLLFCVLNNSLDLLNLEFNTVYLVKGAVIALAALLDVLRLRLRAVGG